MRIQLTVPANTPRETPVTYLALYDDKTLSKQVIKIPRGHAYLTGVQIRAAGLGRIIPEKGSNTEWIVDDDQTITKNIFVEISLPSFSIAVLAFNEDDTYEHTFYIDLS
jgi:hypothetical protein